MSSTMRKINRGRVRVLYNPDSETVEQYNLSARGKFLRGAESLAPAQVDAREEKYQARQIELLELEKAEEKKAIQERARKLEQ
jgi:hypothetical protein